jgi:hypothetical protein
MQVSVLKKTKYQSSRENKGTTTDIDKALKTWPDDLLGEDVHQALRLWRTASGYGA